MTDDDVPAGPPLVGLLIAVLTLWAVYNGRFMAAAVYAGLLVTLTIGYYAVMTR